MNCDFLMENYKENIRLYAKYKNKEVNNTESMEADEKASEIAEEVIEVVDINEYILE